MRTGTERGQGHGRIGCLQCLLGFAAAMQRAFLEGSLDIGVLCQRGVLQGVGANMGSEGVDVGLYLCIAQGALVRPRGGFLTGCVPKVLDPSFGESVHLARVQVCGKRGIWTDAARRRKAGPRHQSCFALGQSDVEHEQG